MSFSLKSGLFWHDFPLTDGSIILLPKKGNKIKVLFSQTFVLQIIREFTISVGAQYRFSQLIKSCCTKAPNQYWFALKGLTSY